jgi:hypothetical protein
MTIPPPSVKGRGSARYLPGRFAVTMPEAVDDGWHDADGEGDITSAPKTELREEVARSVLTRNQSPDIPFDQSLNPYRGCEHGMAPFNNVQTIVY